MITNEVYDNMIRCILFKKNYLNRNNKYIFVKSVEYAIKKETLFNYYTIKNTKLPKRLLNKVYEVLELH